MKAIRISCILLSTTLFSSLSFAQDEGIDIDNFFDEDFETEKTATIHDPLEGLNRAIFNFNDSVYTTVAKPLVNTYRKIMPDPVEKGIKNIFNNLKYPSRLAGNILQGKFKRAAQETGKFVVNTTIGVGGFFNASKNFGDIDPPKEDIGQAFGAWGLGHGFYFIMPFLGPTSVRDGIGNFADGAVEPLPEPWSYVDSTSDRIALRILEGTNTLPGLMDLYDSMSRSSIDKYASVRDAYAQRRAKQVEE